MSKVPFAEYKIGFEKFLKSESGTIYVQCKTFNEALYELQELMERKVRQNDIYFYSATYHVHHCLLMCLFAD